MNRIIDAEVKSIKSKKRVIEHGEVYTSQREVNAMLDLVKNETERIDSRFLEPACGNGNFLAEVLKRKLAIVKKRYSKNQLEFEKYSVLAISSIYGVEILKDNVLECRERLFEIFNVLYNKLYKKNCKEKCNSSIRFILKRNIIWGNALDFSRPGSRIPIVFSEWSLITGSKIKRKDFIFKFLVEKTHQYSLFNDLGDSAEIDEPVKEFVPIHFLDLADDDFSNKL